MTCRTCAQNIINSENIWIELNKICETNCSGGSHARACNVSKWYRSHGSSPFFQLSGVPLLVRMPPAVADDFYRSRQHLAVLLAGLVFCGSEKHRKNHPHYVGIGSKYSSIVCSKILLNFLYFLKSMNIIHAMIHEQ